MSPPPADRSSASTSEVDAASPSVASVSLGSHDDDLAELAAKAHALTAQKTLLTARLRSLQSQFTTPPPTPSRASSPSALVTSAGADADARILSFALSRSQALSKHSLLRLHRIAGVTTFTVQDPGDKQKLVGIRLEVFAHGKFEKPYYVLFSPRKDKRGTYLCIARHSIPAFLGIGRLANEYLSPGGRQYLDSFARKLRTRVVRHRRRLAAAEDLKATALKAGRIGDVMEEWTRRVERVEWDLPVELVTIRWMNGAEGLLRIEESGDVKKVTLKDSKGRRKADLETRIKGHLVSLPARIGWV